MTISLDDLSKLAGEDMRRKDAKRKLLSSDPYKKPKAEPGRARPRPRSRPSTSLGGEHS